jgi:hypothetical protein
LSLLVRIKYRSQVFFDAAFLFFGAASKKQKTTRVRQGARAVSKFAKTKITT